MLKCFLYLCVCVFKCVFVYLYMCVCVLFKRMCVCVIFKRVCLCVCLCVCVYIYMCKWVDMIVSYMYVFVCIKYQRCVMKRHLHLLSWALIRIYASARDRIHTWPQNEGKENWLRDFQDITDAPSHFFIFRHRAHYTC